MHEVGYVCGEAGPLLFNNINSQLLNEEKANESLMRFWVESGLTAPAQKAPSESGLLTHTPVTPELSR